MSHRLSGLQHHIAHKAVAYNHVRTALKEVMPFHIAAELDRIDLLEEAKSLLRIILLKDNV